MGYTKDVIKGVSWTGLLRFITKIIGFLETIILARILFPAQFGAYGIALLALGLLEMLTETGVNTILIQEQDTERYISSAWIVSIFRGFFIMLLLFIATPFIASFFHSQESTMLLYLISLAPFLRGFINPSVVKLQKNLLFLKNFWYQMIILFVDTMISITVTFITKSPVGIVTGLLAGVLIELLLSFLIISPKPNFQFQKEYISKLFHRGKWITLSGIFDYLFFNSDNIAVGRLLGTKFLGIYQLAYSLSVIPLTEVCNVFVYVTFPIFSKISDDRVRLRTAFFKTGATIFIMTIPFAFILMFYPRIAVIILGNKWSAITSVLPVLGVLGLVKAISGSSSALFLSRKKQNYITTITLVNILGLLSTIIPLVKFYGIFGAGLSALIGSLLAVPFIIFYVYKILK